jgi:hypothetical protein
MQGPVQRSGQEMAARGKVSFALFQPRPMFTLTFWFGSCCLRVQPVRVPSHSGSGPARGAQCQPGILGGGGRQPSFLSHYTAGGAAPSLPTLTKPPEAPAPPGAHVSGPALDATSRPVPPPILPRVWCRCIPGESETGVGPAVAIASHPLPWRAMHCSPWPSAARPLGPLAGGRPGRLVPGRAGWMEGWLRPA